MRTALITGSAGFIGYHLSARLLDEGVRVVGLDAMTDYGDPALKAHRHALLKDRAGFETVEARLEDPGLLRDLFARARPDVVVHLAAQAGVRYSIDQPRTYVDSNIIGTFELLEAARAEPPGHLLLASTSSVYGAETAMPYAETMKADTQMSFYAATKKATEAMAHSYAHLYGLPTTMFRFFTVYGPWGRSDMAPFKFTHAVLEGRPIDVYNHGRMRRDFTYVDDLVHAIRLLIDVVPPAPSNAPPASIPGEPDQPAPAGEERAPVPGDTLSPVAPFRIVNIGNSAPVELLDFIAAIETATGRQATRTLVEMQPGDVPATWADASLLRALTGYVPQTGIEEGVARFVAWYRDHYGV